MKEIKETIKAIFKTRQHRTGIERQMRWLILCLLLSGCGIMSLYFGGSTGPTVNSNAQIGKENRQSVLSVEQREEVTAGRDVVQTEIVKEVETGKVENLDIINKTYHPGLCFC